MKLYFCQGCRKVHYDDDYRVEDGDLTIDNFEKLQESIFIVQRQLDKLKENNK